MAESGLPGEHIVCYQLTDSDNCLADVIDGCCVEEDNVVGLIIANYGKSCFLPDEILNNGIPNTPPIYVVSLDDGEKVFDFMSTQVNMGDIRVKVLVESDVDPEKAA